MSVKILIVSNLLYLFGPPISLFRWVKALSRRNEFDISLLSFVDGPLRERYKQIGIRPIIRNLYDVNHTNLKEFVRLIKQEKPDVILCNTLDTITACFAAYLCKKPVIFNIHEDWPQVNLSTTHLFAFQVSDAVVFPSAYAQKVYHPVLDGVPVKVIPDGVDFEEFKAPVSEKSPEEVKRALGIPLDKKVVGIIGTVCDRKQQSLFVFAAHEVLKKRNDVIFLIVGWYREEENYYQLIQKYVQLGGRESQILFTGAKANIQDYFHIVDVLVCCSSNDITPLVVPEALALPIPVVATSIEGIKGMFKNKVHGIYIEPNRQDQLEQAIHTLLDHTPEFQKNIQDDYPNLQKRFSFEKTISRLSRLIRQVRPRPKRCSIQLTPTEVRFRTKKNLVLRYKELHPLIDRRGGFR